MLCRLASHLGLRVAELAGLTHAHIAWQGHRLMTYSKGSLDGGEWSPDCACGGLRGSGGDIFGQLCCAIPPAWDHVIRNQWC